MASRYGRTSSSESVRSCAWNVSRSASERRPAPSASASRQTSKTCTSLSSSPPAARAAASTSLAGCSSATTTAMSWRSGGNSDSGSARRRVAEALAQPVEVELDAHDRIVEAVAPRGQRVQLADEAERLLAAAPARSPCGPGCRNGSWPARHRHDAAGHADGAEDRLEHALAEEERGRLARAPPGGAAQAPAHDGAERPRLARQLLARRRGW